MIAVDALTVEPQIQHVAEIALGRNWPFERVDQRCFRISLSAQDGEIFQLQVDCDEFPVLPAAFHWRNPSTGELDQPSDAPRPNGDFFHDSNRICAPWNRLASTPGGPHTEWAPSAWREHRQTGGTVTLAAMVLRIHHELRSERYKGRHQ